MSWEDSPLSCKLGMHQWYHYKPVRRSRGGTKCKVCGYNRTWGFYSSILSQKVEVKEEKTEEVLEPVTLKDFSKYFSRK